MAQQYIDFGTFPNDPAADPIRAAFQKIQTNFNELYNTTQTSGVNEIIVGPGLSQNRATGNVYITANIPNITIQTSTSLLVGVGAATSNAATISSFNTPFVLNLANTITTANANLTNSVRAGNLTVVNNVASNLIPSANITYNLGSSNLRWKDLYLSGNSIFLGPQTISANAASVSFSNISVSSNIAAGNVFITNNFSSNSVTANANVTTANLSVSSNVLSNLNPVSTETYDLGVTGRRWKSVFAGNITVSNSISTTNVDISGNATTSNLNVANYVTGNLIPLTNEIYNLGNATHKWKDLFLSGNTLTLGSIAISANANSILIPSLAVTSNLSAGTVTATFVDATIRTPEQPYITGVGLLDNLSVAGNIETGELSVVGNLTAATMNVTGSFSAETITGNVVVPPGGTVGAPGNSTQLLFNDNGDTAAVPGLTFDKTSNLLSISGNVSGGNITTSGALVVFGIANVGELGAANLFATGNVSASNFVTLGVLSASAGISSDGNITTSGFLSVVGNASVGNITTTTLSGQVVTVSGNVSGANLIASGVLSVSGNATVGSLITSGNVSGGTFTATLFSGNGSSITGINLFNAGMSVLITATTGTGSIATLTFATQSYAPFTSGQEIIVSGLVPAGYNGTFTVLTCSTTTVTYNGTGTGSMVTEGIVLGGPKSAASLLSDTVVSSSQPNITSLGTLTGLTVGGTFTGSNITSSGFVTAGVSSGVAAAGSVLGSATVLTSQINVVISASSGANGVRLPGSTSGMQVIIINTTAVPIKVYPANGSQIDALGTNTSFPLGAGARLMIVAVSTNQWYTMVGVYG